MFDLVITDMNMPNMNGLSLIEALRGLPEYRHTPLIMLTIESSPEIKQQGKLAGATGWLFKPFDPDKLTLAVDRALH